MKSIGIIGQERPLDILLNSLKANRLANSYLFVGPEGVGKAGLAKHFSKILNCQKNNFMACGICSSCGKIENLNHPDVHWIISDDSSYIKIEQIRRVSQEINLKPFEGKFKVFIILDAQNLTEEASNSLLKTLEEPPLNSLIILTTSRIKKIFPTIISRCQKIAFAPLNVNALKNILVNDYNLPLETSHYLSYSCEGRIGKSLKLINTNILQEKNQIIDSFIRVSGGDYFREQLFTDRQKVKEALLTLMYWFRDILLLKMGMDLSYLVNLDRKKDLLMLKEKYSFEEINHALKDIISVNTYLEQNLNLKIVLSLLKEKLCKGYFR